MEIGLYVSLRVDKLKREMLITVTIIRKIWKLQLHVSALCQNKSKKTIMSCHYEDILTYLYLTPSEWGWGGRQVEETYLWFFCGPSLPFYDSIETWLLKLNYGRITQMTATLIMEEFSSKDFSFLLCLLLTVKCILILSANFKSLWD